jgi:hypothetical protein
MAARLPESSRSVVVQKWLEGQSRNKIAVQCSISQGAVSGIIDDWKKSVGVSIFEQLRDLAVALERNSTSVVECAQGYRIAKLMSKLGILGNWHVP